MLSSAVKQLLLLLLLPNVHIPTPACVLCCSRGKVMEWLAALGAAAPADEHEVRLPELAPHHWQQLHSADPMWTKPQLDR
jgi:hypothetical protein